MFLTDKGASTLLLFFNLLILAFGEHFQFPVTPSTVEKQLGFDQLTMHLVRYAVCPTVPVTRYITRTTCQNPAHLQPLPFINGVVSLS